ncbi:MAG: hypothetical protein JNK63_07435 [Chthonomonas sp.]|nr:hypothetical protein [Chthonomonas sp.]
MRKAWLPSLILAGVIIGCGGSSDVEIASYDAAIFEPIADCRVTRMATSGGTEHIIGQAGGLAFMVTNTPRAAVGFPDQLSVAEDIVADVNSGGDIVGYDSGVVLDTPGLKGDLSSFTPNALGFTLSDQRLRYYAISDSDLVAAILFPASGAGTVYRIGAPNTSFVNFEDLIPSYLSGINDDGKMCGTGTVKGLPHAFMTGADANLIDLGEGTARAMNAEGVVVGKNQDSKPYYTDGGTSSNRIALPLLPGFTLGEAMDINDSGLIVGWQQETEVSDPVPVAWYENGALVDLRTRINVMPADVGLYTAVSISNDGTILIQGRRTTGGLTQLGIILRPTP